MRCRLYNCLRLDDTVTITCKVLRDEQNAKIKDLETAVQQLDEQQSEALQRLKAEHLEEKIRFQKEATVKVAKLEAQAPTAAVSSLSKHGSLIKTQNRQLRKELLELISANRSLQEREAMLKQQHKDLVHQGSLNSTAPSLSRTFVGRTQRLSLSASTRGTSQTSRTVR
eukprot:m.96694 g.96694  ORF g.96694 m.96694 type:complete len:169 (-) comp15200_c1_seq1:132-638(-)